MGAHVVETGILAAIGMMAIVGGFVMASQNPRYYPTGTAAPMALVGFIILLLAARQWYADRLPEVELEKMRERTRIEEARIADEKVRQSWTISDSAIAQIARKYGGVLTKTVLAYETGQSLEMIDRSLQRYLEHREARMVYCGDMTIYDVPSARVHLLGVDKMFVELLLAHSGRSSRAELLRETGLSIEAMDAALTRLEREGIVKRLLNGTYCLAAIMT